MEWLFEDGIGEMRAALVDKGAILEMVIEPESDGPRVGARLEARMVAKADAGGRGRVRFATGEALMSPVPKGLTEGAALMVEVVREAYVEPGGVAKAAVVRATEGAPSAGPDLLARIASTALPVRTIAPTDPDAFEAHGWSEALEEAATGIIAREEALLRISLTPAMTLIDIDGAGAPAALAISGARLAGEAIRRFGIVGSIGLDLPTLSSREDRLAAAAALDVALPQPFERTAVNGFGFLQVVRRRQRASLPELLAADPVRAAACALIRRAERAGGHGALALAAAPPVIERIRADLLDRRLEARIGASVVLRPEPALSISAGHAQREHP